MFKFFKKWFSFSSDYEVRCDLVLDKFLASDNPYDVKVAELILSQRNGTLNWEEADKWIFSANADREAIRESATRFMTEIG